MTIKVLWLVYDFDIGGEFEELYTLLDSLGAKECGNGVASISSWSIESLEELKIQISSIVTIREKDRIYIIYRDLESTKMKGKFLFGKRKRNPWTGYGVELEEEDEEE